MVKTMPDKIFSAATYCTSGGLICTGLAQAYNWFHGLDWNLIAVVGGFVIGIATFISNIYFKRQALKAYPSAIARGIVVAPPVQDE